MRLVRAGPERWWLGGASLLAWAMLVTGRGGVGFDPALPGFCGAGASALTRVPAEIHSVLRVTPLSHVLLEWGLMLAAMMLPPVVRPLERVRARGGSAVLFVAGYGALWLPAMALIGIVSIAVRLALQAQPWAIGIVVAVVVSWHASPLRARCLALCTRTPSTGSLRAGVSQATGCIGACSAIMLLPPLCGRGHLAAMALVTILLWQERHRRLS